ncbi:MAG TPA: response regulator [Candidatus Acidoferrales bacterium]|nr:response regulator [Candidatus Acidoferrales bacterium]
MKFIFLYVGGLQVTANHLADAALAAVSLPGWAVCAGPGTGPIAIVDDDEWVLKSLARLVKSAGFQVETFVSAENFLEVGRDSKTRCVILDIGLPGMSGLDLQRHLAAKNFRVPIIFISAHDETENRTQALAGGAIAFLSKPVDDKELLAALDAAAK